MWDNTFSKTIGVRNGLKFGSAGEEVIAAEKNFRVAAQIFNEAKINARLIGDTAEAAVSRARLARAEDTLLKAADEVDTAYLIRKGEISRSVIKSRLQQARAASLSAKSDELLAAIDSEGITKLDNLLYNPVLRLVPDGAGLRFAVSEDASPALKQSAMEGNELLAKADEATLAEGAITSSARAEGEVELVLLEGLADSEFAIANEVKSKRIQAATGEFVLEEAPQRKIINNELVEPCNLAAAAIYGLAIPCVEPKGVTKTAEVPETPLSEESTRLAEEVAVVERATIPPP